MLISLFCSGDGIGEGRGRGCDGDVPGRCVSRRAGGVVDREARADDLQGERRTEGNGDVVVAAGFAGAYDYGRVAMAFRCHDLKHEIPGDGSGGGGQQLAGVVDVDREDGSFRQSTSLQGWPFSFCNPCSGLFAVSSYKAIVFDRV